LVSEVRQLREERNKLEMALEESKSAQKQAEKVAEEVRVSSENPSPVSPLLILTSTIASDAQAREAARKAADVADALRKAAEAAGLRLDEHLVETSKYLPTSEQEIGLLKAEIEDLKNRVFDPRKAMSMLSQMPMISPMMMGLGGISGLNPLGGMQKVASMPNFLAGMNSTELKRSVDGAAGGK
jgi:hypothetical protein